MLKTKLSLCACALLSLSSYTANANDEDHLFPYGKGIQFGDESSFASAKINARAQMRYTNAYDSDPREADDFLSDTDRTINVNRSRLKVKGHLYQPWFKYFSQFEVGDGYFIDYGIAIEKYKALSFKVGQWKLDYSRERSISSGKQHLVDRSIVNKMFTIDRHNAAAVYGRLNEGTMADFNYWAGVGSGTGRGNSLSGPGDPLYYGRFQWNPLGGGVELTTADIDRHKEPALSVGFARALVEGDYSRFSSSGGSQLPRWEETEALTKVRQYTFDLSYMYQGFSAEAEYHDKIVSSENVSDLTLDGYYVQAGYFLNEIIDWWPKQLEVAGRYATYTSHRDGVERKNEEQSFGVNYFIAGHYNKVSVDFTQFDLHALDNNTYDDNRVRVQWDISF
ncbi:porin [Salinimonas marina]|uniref:Porin n=1 Tax=Salinimonas marina TaxID=2785918 RepID=A0A7S9DVP3_9ALTE|nr:porin [Salinimonas marina]QPG04697.1 porin [Salinimonas marina]